MNKSVKESISKGALGGAVGLAIWAAISGISKEQINEAYMYTSLGLFLLSAFIHLLFWDKALYNLKTIKVIIIFVLPNLAFLCLIAFLNGAYLTMFIGLGFFTVIYLLHLLVGFLKQHKEEIS